MCPIRARAIHPSRCGRVIWGLALLAACPVLAKAAGPAIVPQIAEVAVRSTSELFEALKPERGARTIRLRAGRYVLDAPLVVPDGVELVG
jgi:hypothetical protein